MDTIKYFGNDRCAALFSMSSDLVGSFVDDVGTDGLSFSDVVCPNVPLGDGSTGQRVSFFRAVARYRLSIT